VISAILVCAAVFGFLAWLVPGLIVGAGIAIGAGVGAAIGLTSSRRRGRTDR
jgi:hypothetical protein